MTGVAAERVLRGQAVPRDPTISICVLVMEDVQPLLECLDSLRRQRQWPNEMEIVVVANGTPEHGLVDLTALDDIIVVVNEWNVGFSAGCNQAARVARAPLLVFVNDDSIVQDDCIDALVQSCGSDPTIGAVGSRIVSADGTLQEAGSVIWRDGSASHVGEGCPRDSGEYAEPRLVDYSSANGLLVARAAWDEVGGFDERYFPAYFEDVDLSLSLAARGYRTKYEPSAVLVHRGSQSTTTVFREFLLTRNRLQLVEKWGDALDQFERPPTPDSGPAFEAALRSAVRRASARPLGSFRPCSPVPPRAPTPDPFNPRLAAQELHAAYVAYLEQRAITSSRRILTLETYLTKLWTVRLRRWVGGLLRRRNGSDHLPERPAPMGGPTPPRT